MPDQERLGFRTGLSGAHQARTMMLSELETLLEMIPVSSKLEAYELAVRQENILGKATDSARKLTFEYLKSLYGLEESLPVFRNFRRLWDLDAAARPHLALALALARDPGLRESWSYVAKVPVGAAVGTASMAGWLEERHPKRWKDATRKSLAQNLNGTWTQAGYFKGKVNKVRVHPTWHPVAVTYSLFMGWLEGLRGEQLLQSTWADLWGLPVEARLDEVVAAARLGWMDVRSAGGVLELRFEGWLHPHEERWLA